MNGYVRQINSDTTLINKYISQYTSLKDMYQASMESSFPGVGLLKKKYCLNSLDEEIENITNYFADETFGKIREIKLNKNQYHSVAESTNAHPLHTDASFSKQNLKRFLLSFVEVDKNDSGGASLIFPTEWIIENIPSRLLAALENSDISYTRLSSVEGNKNFEGKMLSYDSEGSAIFRWRYDDYVKPQIIDSKGYPIEEAISWVNNFINTTPPIIYRASPGETLLIDNCKVLHGRTELKPNSQRVALRAWIN